MEVLSELVIVLIFIVMVIVLATTEAFSEIFEIPDFNSKGIDTPRPPLRWNPHTRVLTVSILLRNGPPTTTTAALPQAAIQHSVPIAVPRDHYRRLRIGTVLPSQIQCITCTRKHSRPIRMVLQTPCLLLLLLLLLSRELFQNRDPRYNYASTSPRHPSHLPRDSIFC